jgi:hypothetical protein
MLGLPQTHPHIKEVSAYGCQHLHRLRFLPHRRLAQAAAPSLARTSPKLADSEVLTIKVVGEFLEPVW